MAFQMLAQSHIYPEGTVEDAINIINELGWFLRLFQGEDGKWYIGTGEGVSYLFVSDSQSEAEAFIYGMALVLVTLPEEMYQQIAKKFIGDL